MANSGLGWTKGARWMWFFHAANASLWILYAVWIEQYGLILLSVVTIATDVISGVKMSHRHREIITNRYLRTYK